MDNLTSKRERKEGNVEQVAERVGLLSHRSMSSYLNEPRLSSAAAHSLSRRANKRPTMASISMFGSAVFRELQHSGGTQKGTRGQRPDCIEIVSNKSGLISYGVAPLYDSQSC